MPSLQARRPIQLWGLGSGALNPHATCDIKADLLDKTKADPRPLGLTARRDSTMRRQILLSLLLLPLTCGAASAQVGSSDIPADHPAAGYLRAIKLFQSGKRDQAVFEFYLAQLRFRIYVKARPDLEPSGEPALLGSLNQTIGRPINEYAFGDLSALGETIIRVLEWDEQHDDPATPKEQHAVVRAEVRAGLELLLTHIMSHQGSIREQRRANGLPNRR